MRTLKNITEGFFDTADDVLDDFADYVKLKDCFDPKTEIVSTKGDVVMLRSRASYPEIKIVNPELFNECGYKKFVCEHYLTIKSNKVIRLDDMDIYAPDIFFEAKTIRLRNSKMNGMQTYRCEIMFDAEGCEFTCEGTRQNDIRILDFKIIQINKSQIRADVLALSNIAYGSTFEHKMFDFLEKYRKARGPLKETRPMLQKFYKNRTLSGMLGLKDVNKWDIGAVSLTPGTDPDGFSGLTTTLSMMSERWWKNVKSSFKEYPLKTKDGWYIGYGGGPYSYLP